MILTAPTSSSAAQIQVDDVVFGGLDSSGVKWSFTNLSGWWESAPLRDRMTDRPYQDGMFDASPLRTGRTIVVTGVLRGRTRGAAAAALDQLAALRNDGASGAFTYVDPDLGIRSCQVRLTGSPTVDASTVGTGMARWQIAFHAPDWRKYGPLQTLPTGIRTGGGGLTFPLTFPLQFGTPPSGGRVTFVNSGTAATEPVITVACPLTSGFEITYVEAGRRLRYEAPVGTPVVLDCGAGTCTTQGQERATYLTVREWFSVPGQSTATFSWAPLSSQDTATSAPTAGIAVAIAPAYT